MDSKKILGKYVKPSPILNIIAIILVVATIGMVIMGFVSSANAKAEAGEPELFHPFDSPVDS